MMGLLFHNSYQSILVLNEDEICYGSFMGPIFLASLITIEWLVILSSFHILYNVIGVILYCIMFIGSNSLIRQGNLDLLFSFQKDTSDSMRAVKK